MTARVEIESLYASYGPGVHAKCRRMMGSSSEAEDLTQEVFMRAMQALERFQGEGGQLAWLYRIATNVCLDALRKRRQLISFDDVVQKPFEDEAPLPDEVIARSEWLGRAFADLDVLTQEIVVAYYLDDMTQEEIASLYGVTRRTVFSHLGRFREALAKLREAV